ncbi:MAG: transcriptional regulator PadR [Roseiflexaceae bacterium]
MKTTLSTLGYALLSLLAREAASGYDLTRQLQAPVGFFWRARHSQIYPELARLEADGLVAHEVVAQQDLPDKKVYTVTPAGLAALRAWLTEPIEMAVLRDEMMLKSFSMWLAEPQDLLPLFRDQVRQHQQQLQVYYGLQQKLEQHGAVRAMDWHAYEFATYLTLQKGIRYERQYLEWCEWVIGMLERSAASQEE